jgi:2'-5' RNA ligase
MKRVIVAFPRFEAPDGVERLSELRSRFDPLASLVAPHLTLVFPFEDGIGDRDLADHVEGAVAGARAFPIVLRGVTAHEGEYLFLNVRRGNDELIGLHDVLYTGPLARHLARTHTFVPHLTVGRVPTAALAAALDATAGVTEPFVAVVDAVSVYRVDTDGSRPILGEVRLRPR